MHSQAWIRACLAMKVLDLGRVWTGWIFQKAQLLCELVQPPGPGAIVSTRVGATKSQGFPQEQCKDSREGSTTCKGTWNTYFRSQYASFFSLPDERGLLTPKTHIPGVLMCDGSLAAALAWFLWQTLLLSSSYSRHLAQPLSKPSRACASHSIHSMVLHWALEVHSW